MVNISFNYAFFQIVRKHYAAFNFRELPDIDDVITQFYLNFPKLPGWALLHPTHLDRYDPVMSFYILTNLETETSIILMTRLKKCLKLQNKKFRNSAGQVSEL